MSAAARGRAAAALVDPVVARRARWSSRRDLGRYARRAGAGRRSPYAQRAAAGDSGPAPVLSGSGYIVTGDRYVSIGVRVAGRIDRYFVEEGQSVHKGDPLVQLDDRDYRAAVAAHRGAHRRRRAPISRSPRPSCSAARTLRQQGVISQQEFDVLENKAAVARAAIGAARGRARAGARSTSTTRRCARRPTASCSRS